MKKYFQLTFMALVILISQCRDSEIYIDKQGNKYIKYLPIFKFNDHKGIQRFSSELNSSNVLVLLPLPNVDSNQKAIQAVSEFEKTENLSLNKIMLTKEYSLNKNRQGVKKCTNL